MLTAQPEETFDDGVRATDPIARLQRAVTNAGEAAFDVVPLLLKKTLVGRLPWELSF